MHTLLWRTLRRGVRLSDLIKIPDGYVHRVCKPGKPDCCRYLALRDGMCCVKTHDGLKKMLDDRVAAGTIRATGDNCIGFELISSADVTLEDQRSCDILTGEPKESKTW